ncbi:MAG: phage terminase large subunit [Pygmaiobacter massiliensis]|nr:phage terminase large subunit [Pygmaiobacter massiliensis]
MNYDFGSPNTRQEKFFRAQERFIAYGGARGGGKSWAVRKKAALLALQYPGIRMLLVRRTLPEVRENHILPLITELKGLAEYKKSEEVMLFTCGSRLRFGYCDNETDVTRYQGQEYDVIFLDEATQFTVYQYNTLTACLRGANSFPKRMYLTCNPGGVGHDWVKRLFIDRKFTPTENPQNYRFIPARVYDNTALVAQDTGYIAMLQNLPEDLRRAWLDGDWNVFAGQYFKEFRRELHVTAPFSIPRHWNRYVTLDYGLDMLAAYAVAVDEKGTAYVEKEVYESGLIVSEAAQRVKMLLCDTTATAVLAPPDLWNRRQESGKSVADLFAEYGVLLTRTGNERIPGWLAVKERLRISEEGLPRLRIFESCVNLIRTLPGLQYDPKRPNDVANEPHELTHAPDALRGFCSWWISVPGKPTSVAGSWSGDLLEDYNNTDAAGRAYLEAKYGRPPC